MHRPLIMVAPNGARRIKADHRGVPITTDEIVQTALDCLAAGADALHLHVRDQNGQHSLDAGRYRETIDELAIAVPTMRVQITTESASLFDVPAQMTCLQNLKPKWASISVREIARAPELAAKIYATCAQNGTKVQHILYDLDDIERFKDWTAKGTIASGQDSVILVLGRYTHTQTSDPADIAPLVGALPVTTKWMLCAFGQTEHACLIAAAALGGGVRVGFENSLLNAQGIPHDNNAASVASLIAKL